MINSVRNTVLSVLNKNNYGYISPSDFNLFAKNAQMELYDEYFNNYNKIINSENARMSGVDYADLKKSMSENMENLMRTDFLVQVTAATNKYYMPTATTTGSEAYMINKIICHDPITGARLGEAEKVTNSSITLLIESPLTSPTTKYPAYTLQGETITVYPDIINGVDSLECSYFSFPLAPKWTYITLFNGEPAFDQSQPDYQDFQLPQQDEYKLVMKILQYCGISIRENEVVGYAINQEQYEQPTFSQKQ